ncbi:proteasome assembly chaperone 3-like [Daktulosphaira vitifoliae]|uniref:proteasome assembly chaperone 3-like n=1 Tax=Daktulosphaira vitifoliae TaxID=58002 RepID=UPI0021A9C88B|nr:proteasome assembly chaperone 3-like [Daktulosphaira vitifoliae]
MNFKVQGALLDGIHTDFIVALFENTIFIIVTQNSKLGTFYLYKPECLSTDDQGYDIKVLFGCEDENLTAGVASLLRALNIDRRVIICLMLENSNFRTIRAIQEIISNLI